MPAHTNMPGSRHAAAASPAAGHPLEAIGWWLKLVLQPLLLLLFISMAFAGLGVVQRFGWLSSNTAGTAADEHTEHAGAASYICPMMCTPPSSKPGRCPVCGMELVPAAKQAGSTDGRSVVIDAAARRVAGIETVDVRSTAARRTIEGIGRLDYDEGGRKTLADP